ncbi:MAG TPA: sortase [Actinomycetota bacterium]|nr:sortase [Actinomycetota bacterium]
MSVIGTEVPAPRRRVSGHTVMRWIGIACLMGAAYFAGYVAWLLWGTGLETQRAQDALRPTTEQWIADPKPPSEAPPPGGARVIPGDAYGVIVIPSIGLDMVVVQGTDYESLKEGPGHYVDTADPWDGAGRVGIAGHRTTYLAPFLDLDAVQIGDTISLHTEYGRYDYEVTANFVLPAETAGRVLEQTADPTLVLTTCNPKYASSQRLIVEANLVDSPDT